MLPFASTVLSAIAASNVRPRFAGLFLPPKLLEHNIEPKLDFMPPEYFLF